MKLILPRGRVRLVKALNALFLLLLAAMLAAALRAPELIWVLMGLALAVGLAGGVLADRMVRCPRCGTHLYRTDVARTHFLFHFDDLPAFCQKCGWQVEVERPGGEEDRHDG